MKLRWFSKKQEVNKNTNQNKKAEKIKNRIINESEELIITDNYLGEEKDIKIHYFVLDRKSGRFNTICNLFISLLVAVSTIMIGVTANKLNERQIELQVMPIFDVVVNSTDQSEDGTENIKINIYNNGQPVKNASCNVYEYFYFDYIDGRLMEKPVNIYRASMRNMNEYVKNKQSGLMYDFNLVSCEDTKFINLENGVMDLAKGFTSASWDIKYGYLINIQCYTTLDKIQDYYFVVKNNNALPIKTTTGVKMMDETLNSFSFSIDDVTAEWLLEYSLYHFLNNGYQLMNSYGGYEDKNYDMKE